ncbi:MAG: flagellar basal body P-ring protein FlgI, partial [candidate division Zixibacteria bacterium]|nr:flagellar basal body P-ring protein FlgI [candidate division Zixibacteria bacterium]
MMTAFFARLATPAGLVMLLSLMIGLWQSVDAAKVRIKDICAFQNSQEVDLIGYGLIIGLDGSGDGNGTQFTIQSLTNMMERMGLTVDAGKVKVKNVAAVMVTGKISSHQSDGTYFDVTVSSVGDASSLQGGTLLMTPMTGLDGTVRAIAQGAVSIGGFNVQVDEGNKIVENYTLVGRVPNGGKITASIPGKTEDENEFLLSVHNPDFTTVSRIAERINIKYGLTAYAIGAGTVRVIIPDSLAYPSTSTRFIADIGQLQIVPDNIARVVMNEKTGTIVAGQHVTIEPVAIAHGTITVNIQSTPSVSQPEPFSSGETVVTRQTRLQVNAENARVIHMKGSVYLSDVAKALN